MPSNRTMRMSCFGNEVFSGVMRSASGCGVAVIIPDAACVSAVHHGHFAVPCGTPGADWQNTVAADSVAPETDAIHGSRCTPGAADRRLRVARPSFGAGRLHARRMRAPAAWRWTHPVAAGTL